ncbi:MAG: family 43 glycosylhydrolase [Anaerolineaceae bacterium]|nr:family 43 glycosylhydrolase [Anaerolineaceae bacterium]
MIKPFSMIFALLMCLGLLAACMPVQSTLSSTVEPTPTEQEGEVFQNPVLRENFADPFILEKDGVYWVYATNASGRNISLAKSTNLIKWQVLGDAMPALPKWAKLTGGLVWAPEVIEIDGQYVMYYTARDKATDRQCVGAAVSDKPEGKFKDTREQPLVCQDKEGGTIDASPFRDEDGRLYLYYKNDGNCCGMATYIYAQELAPDGLSLVGDVVPLIRNDALWEAHVIEAPTMFRHDGRYFLFYSGNNYAGHEYAVGYAVCESPMGPCQKADENPILASDLSNKDAMVIGPGHQTILQVGEQTWLVYHAWEVVSGSRRGDRRFMWIDRLDWVDGKPDIPGPTIDPQPVPVLP